MNEQINKLLADINKNFGKNKVITFDGPVEKMPTISSGSLAVNHALNGGYALGRIIEVYGDNGSGKTTLTLHAIVEAQKLGQTCAFIDMEHAFNPEYAESLGVNMKELIFTQPDFGEEAFSITEALIKSGKVQFIVIDSVAAMVPKAELEGEMGESKMGVHARMMGQAMRKLSGISEKSGVTLFFINQTREKIGVMFGDPTTTTGGNALKFYCSQRVQLFPSTKIKSKDSDDPIGQKVIVKIVKNKIGSPHKKTEFDLIYGKGIDAVQEVIDLAVEFEIIKKAGAGWFSYGDIKLGQGNDNLKELFTSNEELYQEIVEKVKSKLA